MVITAPAPDPGAERIRASLAHFARQRSGRVFVESLGSRRYRGLLALAGAMVGNSSSGLSEAPCVGLPVVNIGTRQAGRDRAANGSAVPAEREAIARAVTRALDPTLRASLSSVISPYGDGHTAARVVEVLARLPERDVLLRKRFVGQTGPMTVGGYWP